MWAKIEFHCIQHSEGLWPTAEWGTGVLLLGILLSEALNWCKMSVLPKVFYSPLSPPQDSQYAKRYLSQVSMKSTGREYRKRVLADALPFSKVLSWRSLCGEATSIYLFLSIYSVTSSQFISHKAVQPSPENFIAFFIWLPTFRLLSTCFLLYYLMLSVLLLEDVVSLYFFLLSSTLSQDRRLKITDQA